MTTTHTSVCCGFCGLLCDDLTLEEQGGALQVTAAGCARASTAFARVSGASGPQRSPRIKGQPTDLPTALAAAAKLLAGSQLPLFAGLGTDIHGMRGLMNLADHCGAVLDHMNATAKFRNILTVQGHGWITTTFAEVRNRADLIVVIGSDVVSRFPRFYERLVWPEEALFVPDLAQRKIVSVGTAQTAAAQSPQGVAPHHIPCNSSDLPDVLAALRARFNGQHLTATEVAGISIADLDALAQQIHQAQYAVLVWLAPDLDFPQAELTTQMIAGLLDDINQKTRAAGLPLGGNDGDFSADAVLLWQSGFPFRTSLASGKPDYDPHLYSTDGLLARGEVDALLWVSSLDSRDARPKTTLPTVVLASAGMPVDDEVAVWIPVATPGVDCEGHLFRGDKILALPLRALIDTGLPTIKTVAQGILKQLESA
jgi:formylmethanofuran dehydrogenase subunit B